MDEDGERFSFFFAVWRWRRQRWWWGRRSKRTRIAFKMLHRWSEYNAGYTHRIDIYLLFVIFIWLIATMNAKGALNSMLSRTGARYTKRRRDWDERKKLTIKLKVHKSNGECIIRFIASSFEGTQRSIGRIRFKEKEKNYSRNLVSMRLIKIYWKR